MINYRMSQENHSEVLTGESLLKASLHLKIFAMTTIAVLSTGMAVIVYGQLRQGGPLAGAVENPSELLRGFVFLMLLTVGYLIGKSWKTTLFQRRLIERLLEEKTFAEARRLNPITQFHHPEVCRDILHRQASYAKRQQTPLSILEVSVPNLANPPHDPANQPISEELVAQMKGFCRPIDCLLRWTPDSFLLVLPEVSADQLPAIRQRIERELEAWMEKHLEETSRPELHIRAATSNDLDASGDILVHVQRLLEQGSNFPSAVPEEWRKKWNSAKSVGLAMKLQVSGVDQAGNSFHEEILTERVANDRIWFPLDKKLPKRSFLTITSPDGDFQEFVTVISSVQRAGVKLLEAQFVTTPDHWVVNRT
ncbi:MAG: hypothetical protein IH935_04250 [Acidobacteria bacterium]|nr:hypothetical protein [Acidobacteriota bacterium]